MNSAPEREKPRFARPLAAACGGRAIVGRPVSRAELEHPWQRIRSELRSAVTDSTWHLWLEPLELRALRDGTLTLAAPDSTRTRVADRYGRLLQACAAAVVGPDVVVELVAPDAREEATQTPAEVAPGPADASLNPRYCFDQFVIGESNRLAHAAALAVAEMPGLAYNPLFLCGPPGLGKTHLLHSIGNYVLTHGGGATVRYTTAEEFTNHFVAALHGGDIDAFKAAYRGVDVLLVDDVQFLQNKARTEQEFFHTFNALHATGAQLVLSSDRLPSDMDALENRLRERFEAGLVCDLRPPDLEVRRTILRKRAHQDGVGEVDPEALELIAHRVHANIRALEGALVRVVAFASLTGRPVTAALTAEVLDGLYPDLRPRGATVREIQERTAAAFGIEVDDLLSPSRAAPVIWPRQVAMYLARELTDQSLPAIGDAFGGRSHTTVMNACRRTAERIAGDAAAFDAVRRLTEELK
jgi:chromosomal replication initiator protein